MSSKIDVKNELTKADSKNDSLSDTEEESFCPLCVEEIDLVDKNFLPCPCGYRVCMWCWHHIRENLNGLCPACRTPYKEDPHAFAAVDRQEIVKRNKEKRLKEKEKKSDAPLTSASGRTAIAPSKSSISGSTTSSTTSSSSLIDRKSLHNFRVVQRNLVYVIGLPASLVPSEDTLRKPEFFGQYGKIGKVVVHRNSAHSAAHNTVSAYVTFTHKEDAKAAIQALDGHWLDSGTLLRASFGTTKYCNNFVRGVPCNNPECVYLHEIGDDEDRFTKEEIQAGHSKLTPTAGTNQMVVTGNGGPSGTGKKPAGDPILPPPVFVQDLPTNAPPTTSVPKSNPTSSTAPSSLIRNTSWTAAASSNTSFAINASSVDRKASNDNNTPVNDNNSESSATSTNPSEKVNTSQSAGAGLGLSQSNSNIYQNIQTNVGNSTVNGGNSFDEKKPNSVEEINSIVNGSVSSVNVSNADSQSNLTQTTHSNSSFVHDGMSPVDMLAPLQRLASGARSESLRHQVAASAFNGLGSSTVFPVPVSSLSISIWSVILTNSGNSLELNPYEKLSVPISELMDLTLPPVDALGSPPWPKPLSYYRRGFDTPPATVIAAGVAIQQPVVKNQFPAPQATYTPSNGGVGQPIVGLPTGGVANPANVSRMDLLQLKQHQLRQQEIFARNRQLQQQLGMQSLSGLSSINSPQVGNIQPGNQSLIYQNNGGLGQQLSTQNIDSQSMSNVAVLQQMFPSVKLNYGAPGPK